MAPMPVEAKALFVAAIVILVGLIAVYHVWLDRRVRGGQDPSPSAPPAVTSTPGAATPPAPAREASRTRPVGARRQRARERGR